MIVKRLGFQRRYHVTLSHKIARCKWNALYNYAPKSPCDWTNHTGLSDVGGLRAKYSLWAGLKGMTTAVLSTTKMAATGEEIESSLTSTGNVLDVSFKD